MPITVFARANRRAEILIHEAIGADFFGDGLTSKRFLQDLEQLGDVSEILVRINSPGGAVFDGIAIFNALKAHKAHKHVQVEGLAASIASLIAMCGDRISMSAGAQMMVHNPWTVSVGDANDMREVAATLDQVAASMSDIYASRTRQQVSDVRELMNAETWFDGAGAVAKGFADEHEASESVTATLTEQHRAEFKRFAATAREQLSQLSPLQIAAAVKFIEENEMRIAASATPPAPPSATAADILAAERTRRSDIRNRFGRFSDAHRALLDSCLDDPAVTPQSAGERLLAALGSQYTPLAHPGTGFAPTGEDFRAAAVDALCLRAGITISQPHPAAADLRRTSVLELARTCLSQAGRSHRGLEGGRVIRAALSTSDFPGILENTLGKALRNGYEADPQSHKAWVHATQVPDFKAASRLLLGSAPSLQLVPELSEYQYGSLAENKTTLTVSKYGRALKLSWEMLINDDLAAFIGVAASMGAAARRKEADDVYALFTANSGAGQTMQDTVSLFHANHGI